MDVGPIPVSDVRFQTSSMQPSTDESMAVRSSIRPVRQASNVVGEHRFVIPTTQQRRTIEGYNGRASLYLGILQLISGSASLLLGCVDVTFGGFCYGIFHFTGFNIWCSIFVSIRW